MWEEFHLFSQRIVNCFGPNSGYKGLNRYNLFMSEEPFVFDKTFCFYIWIHVIFISIDYQVLINRSFSWTRCELAILSFIVFREYLEILLFSRFILHVSHVGKVCENSESSSDAFNLIGLNLFDEKH